MPIETLRKETLHENQDTGARKKVGAGIRTARFDGRPVAQRVFSQTACRFERTGSGKRLRLPGEGAAARRPVRMRAAAPLIDAAPGSGVTARRRRGYGRKR
jgi:hypothetical protein